MFFYFSLCCDLADTQVGICEPVCVINNLKHRRFWAKLEKPSFGFIHHSSCSSSSSSSYCIASIALAFGFANSSMSSWLTRPPACWLVRAIKTFFWWKHSHASCPLKPVLIYIFAYMFIGGAIVITKQWHLPNSKSMQLWLRYNSVIFTEQTEWWNSQKNSVGL